LNYKQLEIAFRKLHEKYPNAKLLISSIGPKVDYEPLMKLSEEINTIGLQFSVHETTDEKRNQLIPFKEKITLKQLSEVGEVFLARTGRKPFFNYCAKSDNDSIDDANRLNEIFNPDVFEATISVVCERDETIARANERQRKLAVDFMDKLINLGYSTRIFDPAGQDDTGSGCGQLFHVQKWFKENPDIVRKSVGYGKPIINSPQ
jgi:23S rRNA (adenine2503-C2)-methyltransferase